MSKPASGTSGKDPRYAYPRPPYPEQTQPHPGMEHLMVPRPDYGRTSYCGHNRLTGKVALITGGDSGIGRAVALAYAREGADVAISYLEEHIDANEIQQAVEEAGRRALLLPGDLADPEHCRTIVEETVTQLGRLDILVNNAAFQGKVTDDYDELAEPERVEYTFRSNIMAMFYTVRAALPHLGPGSTIINVSSIQAYDPSPSILDYATTKGAIVTFTKGLSRKLIERGIRVNSVAPGAVWTPLLPQSLPPEMVAKAGAHAPIGRAAQPVEIAPMFVYLASDESSFVIGQNLGITGGELLP